MRLGIDAREIQNGVYTGIGQPLNNFLKYFAQQNNDDSCVLFSSKPIDINYGSRIKNVVINQSITFLWDQVQLSQAIKKESIDLFYSPYYKVPLFANCVMVSAILDIMYLKFEPYRRNLGLFKELYYKTLGKKYALKADKIFTCSEFSKKDIIEFYGVKEDKIKVIPLSVGVQYKRDVSQEALQHLRIRFNIDLKYLLYIGNFKPHKNVLNIINAFEIISNTFPNVKLVLAGPKEYTFNQLVERAQQLNLIDKIIFTGRITSQDQPHILYSNALVSLMPSFYEGFGLPVIESMACGTPVVASNGTSIPEVVKDAGILVDPNDVEQLSEALIRILKDEQLKNEFVRKGYEYIKEYEERKVAKLFYDFLKITYEQHAQA